MSRAEARQKAATIVEGSFDICGRVVVASTLGRKPTRRQAHYKNGEMTRPARSSTDAKSARFEQARLC